MSQNISIETAVTEQQSEKFTQVLLNSRNRFRAFVDAVPDALCVLDSELRVVSANRAYADWHGLHPREVIGHPPSCPALAPAEIPGLARMARKAIGGRAEISEVQKSVSGGGQDYWLEIRFSPLLSVDDDEEYVALVLRDVTRQKSMEEQIRGHAETLEGKVRERTAELEEKTARLEQTVEQLHETEKVKRDLFNMIVHDLKSPLAQVMANLEMLDNAVNDENTGELITSARIGGDDMAVMIGNLLDLERMETHRLKLNFEPVDPAELVEKAAERNRAHARLDHIQLEVSIDEPMPPMILDKSLIGRVLQNLLMNAIEFSPEGESIVIEPRFSAETMRLEIAVIDRGPGIAENQRQAIFQKFQQAQDRKAGSGTGLGLAFCKMAIEAHHGDISVWPGPEGKGSRFSFWLPLLGMNGEEPIQEHAGANGRVSG